MNYYNEFDPFAAAWLRELIKAGEIPDGIVDERSITEVSANELRDFTQCHFFAGIGGWSRALQLAGWSSDKPVWTGSCPCQPFSSAGNQKGKSDERHLWPSWFNLIKECRPTIVFGEQVASAITHGWLDDVYQGMEREGYAVGSAILPAISVGAPHKRDRLWFVADASSRWDRGGVTQSNIRTIPHGNGESDMADANNTERRSDVTGGNDDNWRATGWKESHGECGTHCANGSLADTSDIRCEQRWQTEGAEIQGKCAKRAGQHAESRQSGKLPGGLERLGGRGFWVNGQWNSCADEKARLVEPNISLLADGVLNRVGKLRGYGNAIVPQVAAEFIKAAS